MYKKTVRYSNLNLPCGQAKPGQKLASFGLNMAIFCREFNDKTKGETPGKLNVVKIKVFTDKTYQLAIKGSRTIDLIKEYSKENIISEEDLNKVAQAKLPYLNTESLEKAQKIIAGTARSASIKIK